MFFSHRKTLTLFNFPFRSRELYFLPVALKGDTKRPPKTVTVTLANIGGKSYNVDAKLIKQNLLDSAVMAKLLEYGKFRSEADKMPHDEVQKWQMKFFQVEKEMLFRIILVRIYSSCPAPFY